MDESELSEEILLLEEIYIHELDVTRNSSGRAESVELQLHPATGEDLEQRYVCMTLTLDLPQQYPDVSPEFTIKNPRGVSEEEIQSVLEDMHKLCEDRRGGPVLYELIELAKEILTVGNIPHCPCAICLEHFSEGDKFTRTECYHFFHESCLARYVGHEATKTPDIVPAHSTLANLKKNKLQCPVCRERISYEPDSLQSLLPEEPVKFVPTPEMRAMQKKMAATLERQRAKGGIIDIEAEKNKYLIRDDDVILLTLPTPTVPENIDEKVDKNKRPEKGEKYRRHSPREKSYTKDKELGAFKKVKSDTSLDDYAERYDKDDRPLSGFRKRMGRGVNMKDSHAPPDADRHKEKSGGRQSCGERERLRKDTVGGEKGSSDKQSKFDKKKSDRDYFEDMVKDYKAVGNPDSRSPGDLMQKQERKGFGVPARKRTENEENIKQSTTASKNDNTIDNIGVNESQSCNSKSLDKEGDIRDGDTSTVKDEKTGQEDHSKSKDIREDGRKGSEKRLDSARGGNGTDNRPGSGYRRRQDNDNRKRPDSYNQRNANQSQSCNSKSRDKERDIREGDKSIVKDEKTGHEDRSKSKNIREDGNQPNEKRLDSARGGNGTDNRPGSGYRTRQDYDYRKQPDSYNQRNANQSQSSRDKERDIREGDKSIFKDEKTGHDDRSKSKDIREDGNQPNEKRLDSARGGNGTDNRPGSGYRTRQDYDYRKRPDSYNQRNANKDGNRRGFGVPGRRDATARNSTKEDNDGAEVTQNAEIGGGVKKDGFRNDTKRFQDKRYGERKGFGKPPNTRQNQKSEDRIDSNHVVNKNEKEEIKTENVNSSRTGGNDGEVVHDVKREKLDVKDMYNNGSNEVQLKSGRLDVRKAKPPGIHNQPNINNDPELADKSKKVVVTRNRGRGRGYNGNKYRSDAMGDQMTDAHEKVKFIDSLPKQMSDLTVKDIRSKESPRASSHVAPESSLCSKKPPGFNLNPPPGLRTSDKTCENSSPPGFHS